MKTGEIIKSLRKQRGINQAELGEIIGLTDSAISSIESGRSEITTKALKEISEFFEVSTDYILFGIETERTISESEQEILEILREDEGTNKVLREMVNIKKKMFSYAKDYRRQQEQQAAMS